MLLLAPCRLIPRPTLWCLLAVQVFPACHSASTMPDGVPLPVVFSSSRVYSGQGSPTFEVSPQAIHVTGIVPVNTPCYDFSATATLRGDTVDVVILATSRSGICQQVPAAYQYDALSEVPTGSHTVTLRYKYEGFLKYETLVATTDLAVP